MECIFHANKCHTSYHLPLAAWHRFKLEVSDFTQFYNGRYKPIYYIYKFNAKIETHEILVEVVMF